jgi:hypothetical protein
LIFLNCIWLALTLQFGTAEVLQNLFPVGRVFVSTKVRLELATQNFQSGTFSDTVGSDQTEDLTGAGHGKTVKLETVGRVTVGDLGLEVGGQVDNVNGTEGALLGTDTTTNTQSLGDEGDLGGRVDLNAKLSCADHGTRLLALLTTFLQLISS